MKRIFVSMNLQADIKWIMTELEQVNDPHLVQTLKQLLISRRSKRNEMEFDKAFEKALADKEAGRMIPHEEVRTKYDKWL